MTNIAVKSPRRRAGRAGFLAPNRRFMSGIVLQPSGQIGKQGHLRPSLPYLEETDIAVQDVAVPERAIETPLKASRPIGCDPQCSNG
jgi:hypothetical protein